MKTTIDEWQLEKNADGWYWYLEKPNGLGTADVWESDTYDDRQCAIDDFKEMAEQRGFKVR
jgi:hypothetical protein